MANYVINKVVFESNDEKKLKEIFEAIKGDNEIDGEIPCISFNKIIPMPESLSIECGSITDNALAVYLTEKGTISYEDSKLSEYVRTILADKDDYCKKVIERITEKTDEELNDLYEKGKTYVFNKDNYGFTNWYDWSIAKWGTKWDACYCNRNGNMIEFQTAWSCPFPIFEALSKKFNIDLSVEYADEDIGGGNCGYFSVVDGDICDVNYGDDNFGAQVWGFDDVDAYYGE